MSRGNQIFSCPSCGKEHKPQDLNKLHEVEFKDISFFFCDETCQKEYIFKKDFRKKDE